MHGDQLFARVKAIGPSEGSDYVCSAGYLIEVASNRDRQAFKRLKLPVVTATLTSFATSGTIIKKLI